jgi:hypothetical protein
MAVLEHEGVRLCKVCGAHLNSENRHRHEDADWRPKYDDLEGALEGYETVPAMPRWPADHVRPHRDRLRRRGRDD